MEMAKYNVLSKNKKDGGNNNGRTMICTKEQFVQWLEECFDKHKKLMIDGIVSDGSEYISRITSSFFLDTIELDINEKYITITYNHGSSEFIMNCNSKFIYYEDDDHCSFNIKVSDGTIVSDIYLGILE